MHEEKTYLEVFLFRTTLGPCPDLWSWIEWTQCHKHLLTAYTDNLEHIIKLFTHRYENLLWGRKPGASRSSQPWVIEVSRRTSSGRTTSAARRSASLTSCDDSVRTSDNIQLALKIQKSYFYARTDAMYSTSTQKYHTYRTIQRCYKLMWEADKLL